MFPIRDHNPSDRTPFVTYALIFLICYPASAGHALSAFYSTWGLVPFDLFRAGEFQTLVTSQFLHGGWIHLADNMLFLWTAWNERGKSRASALRLCPMTINILRPLPTSAAPWPVWYAINC